MPRARTLRATLLAALLPAVVALAASPATAVGNSADRLIVWHSCEELADFSDAELDAWKARGVDGFACTIQHLPGLGGSHAFERRLADANVGPRLRARGMRAYLGFYLVNYWNAATPLAEWFDDREWSRSVEPALAGVAGTARRLGFTGLAFDQELYTQADGRQTATWDWDYPGNSRPEREVRAKARQRGREVMRTLVERFPRLELLAYDVQFPDAWLEVVRERNYGPGHSNRNRLDIDFWDGLTSVEGYGPLRLLDATFYKSPHYGSWDSALEYQMNSTFAMLSRRLSNWDYAADRMFVSPFSWIDRGSCGCAWEEPRDAGYVAEQLSAFRKWGMGGVFANYSYAGLREFDYSAYDGAIRSASDPGEVDGVDPSVAVATVERSSRRAAELTGTADDNLAVKAVRWRARRGTSGTARMRWQKDGDPWRGYEGEIRWTSGEIPLRPGRNVITVTVEDIKGRTTTRRVAVSSPVRQAARRSTRSR